MKKEREHVKHPDRKKMSKKRRVTFNQTEDVRLIPSNKQTEDIADSPAVRDAHDLLETHRKLNQKKKKMRKPRTEPKVVDDDEESSQSKPKSSRKKKFKRRKKASKNESTVDDETSTEAPKESSNKAEKAFLYLERWEYDRVNWKFEKLTQLWLLKNMFDETKIPEKYFQILLKYLIDLKGASKNFATDMCKTIVKKKEKSRETDDKQLEFAYQRARSVLQCLQ